MEKELRQVISAIENGKKIQDNRGIVYTQEFGESFLNKLKNIVNQQSYICPKTNQNCDDEMCDSASNCNISSEIKENKEPSFEEISNQFHQIVNDFKHPFEEYEMKSCKTYSDNQETMPKQETLEEDLAKTDNEKLLYQIAYNRGVLYGIKWQQEQDKKLYSEEDLQTAFSLGRTYEYSNHESTNQLEIVQYLDNLKKQKKKYE